MTRKEELLQIINNSGFQNDIKVAQLIDEIVFIEEQLVELKKLPFIMVNKSRPTIQKTTPAARQYKELLQQYNNCLRTLFRIDADARREEAKAKAEQEEESPLRKWARGRQE